MLILIGAAPTAYALNRALPAESTPAFVEAMQRAHDLFEQRAGSIILPPDIAEERVTDAVRTRNFGDPAVYAGIATLADQIAVKVRSYGTIRRVPAAAVQNVRNRLPTHPYLVRGWRAS